MTDPNYDPRFDLILEAARLRGRASVSPYDQAAIMEQCAKVFERIASEITLELPSVTGVEA